MVRMILITGASGRLGKELSKNFKNVLTPSHKELDVTNKENVANFMKTNNPDMIIHLAAMTNVPLCEDEKEKAWEINVKGTLNVLNAAEGRKVVLMSTPCVFSGKEGMYKESDTPNPENYYGLTKVAAENAVLSSPNNLVIRSNFVPREKWPHEGAFTDRWGTYLFADELAKKMKDVIESGKTGIIHIAGDKKMSMYDIAKQCPDSENVKPISYVEYLKNTGYRLTQDMTLDSER
jgi:dTDP-4-dehydrorhamnose reductase